MRVLRRNRGWATLDVRNDFIALGEAVSGYGPSKVVMIMAGIILHGFYHPAAVQRMASALRLPGERGQGGMEWALAALGSYDEMLKVCRAYRGPQGFPYRWIKQWHGNRKALGEKERQDDPQSNRHSYAHYVDRNFLQWGTDMEEQVLIVRRVTSTQRLHR